MKAPDKVYIHTGPHLGMLAATAISVNAPGEQEYIRKDALLEWANDSLKLFREDQQSRDKNCSIFSVLTGGISAMESLIDKINSL